MTGKVEAVSEALEVCSTGVDPSFEPDYSPPVGDGVERSLQRR